MPLILPAQITAGDSLSYAEPLADYSAADGWVLQYALSNGTDQYQIDSTAEGSAHRVAVTITQSAAWTPGRYRWQAFAAKGDERFTLARGYTEIRPDFLSSAADPRHHVEKTLDALEAMLEGKASQDQQTLTLNGRSLTRLPLEELLKWRDKYRGELKQLRVAERLAQGLGSGRRIMVRF